MKGKTIFTIIVIILIIACGVYVYQKYQTKDVSSGNVENLQNVEKENTEVTKTNTINTTNETNTTSTNDKTNNETTITIEDATRILEAKYGTVDSMTGNTMSYGYITKVKDSKGNEYYAFRESWLVDNSHSSFLQNVFVSLDGKIIKTSSEPVVYEENQVVTFDEE